MMIYFMINLYNDLKIWHGENQDKVENYYKFMDELRNYSESTINNNKFFQEYFNLITLVFDCDLYKTDEFAEYCKTDQRPARLQFCSILALVWNCGYNKNNIEEFVYLLNNLHFDAVKNSRRENTRSPDIFAQVMKIVLDLTSNIAGSKLSIMEFISKTPDYEALNKIPSVRPLDWREEHIKSKFLVAEHLPFNYFDDIENDFNRRIRFFLYISGFWSGTGTKSELEKYIDLAKRFEITGNNSPNIIFKKLFYLLATGYGDIAPISQNPTIETSLYFWETDEQRQTEKIHLFRRVFDYIVSHNFKNYTEIESSLKTIADNLYHNHDWRSLVLSRDYESLFVQYDDKASKLDMETPLSFIPIVIMMKDISAKSGAIQYKCTQNRGTVGQNIQSNRRITNGSELTIIINLKCENKEQYIFHTIKERNIAVYSYLNFENSTHNFIVKTFNISHHIEMLNTIAEKIKEQIEQLDNRTKTDFIYNQDDSNLKKECNKK